MDRKHIEILGAAGHGAGLVVNLLGVVWNWGRNWKFVIFHTTAAAVHAYAVGQHVKEVSDGQEE